MGISIEKMLGKYFSYFSKQDDQTFYCEVCWEPFPSTTIHPLLSTNIFTNGDAGDECLRHYCVDCIAKHIQLQVRDHNLADVKCIGLNCKHFFRPLSCRPIIPPEVFEKWCDVLCNRRVVGLERCYCPNKNCSEVIVNECGDKSVARSECPICGSLYCFQCKTEWHDGYSCSEMKGKIEDENERLLVELAEKEKWKNCPACGWQIECVSGCPEIICRCNTKFCYICGEKLRLRFLESPCACNFSNDDTLNRIFFAAVNICHIFRYLGE